MRGNLHVGVIYDSGEMMRVLHFATHEKVLDEDLERLLKDEPDKKFRWVQLNLDATTKIQVAALCIVLAEKNSQRPIGLPYGFHYHLQEKSITESGEFVDENFRKGLTCATFVLGIFRALDIELLKVDEWSVSSGNPEYFTDLKFQSEIARLYGQAFGEQVGNHLNNQIGLPRYRPEQVAAGSTVRLKPISRQQADKIGQNIVRRLNTTYQPNSLQPAR